MPRKVTVNTGFTNVNLPNGLSYNAGDTVVLTDEQGAKLLDTVFTTVVQPQGTAVLTDNGPYGLATSVITVQAAYVAPAAAATAVAVATTAPTTTTPYGYTTSAQATAIYTAINALIVDVAAIRTTLNNELAALQVAGGPQA